MTNEAWQHYVGRLRAEGTAALPALAPLWTMGKIIVTAAVPQLALDSFGNSYFNPHYLEQLRLHFPPVECRQRLIFYWIRALGHLWCAHGERARAIAAEPWRWQLAAELALGLDTWPGFEPTADDQLPSAGAFGLAPHQGVAFYYRQLQKRAVRPVVSGKEARVGDYVLWDGGSAVHGQVRPWELAAHGTKQEQATSWDLAIAREQVRSSLLNAPQIPASWRRWARDNVRSRVDWRRVLRQQIQGSLQQVWGQRLDYTYQRPARRPWAAGRFVLPSLRGGAQPSLAVVLDTSASMSIAYLEQAMAEILKLLLTFRTPLTLIPCDTRAYAATKLHSATQLVSLHFPDGGGTDLRTGIAAALKLGPQAGVILVLTDGETPWPAQRPPVPVVAGLLVSPGQAAPKWAAPDWLRYTVIIVEN